MAITTLCASPTTLPSLKPHHASLSQPFSNRLNLNSVSNTEALTIIASAAEAVALANAALQAAREAVALVGGERKDIWRGGGETCGVVEVRKRKVRGCRDDGINDGGGGSGGGLVKVKSKRKSWYLSSSEEAEFCLGLKV